MNDSRSLDGREAAARSGRLKILREVDVPRRCHRIVVGNRRAVVERGAVPDDVQRARPSGRGPGEDRRIRGGLVDLDRSRPRLAEVGREAVEEVVIVVEHGVDVSSAVHCHVDELVPVGDRRVGIVVDDVIGERLAAVDRDADPDRVLTAVRARQFGGVCDRAPDLVDDVIPGIDREVSNLVLQRGVEQVRGVERAGVLGEGQARVVAAVDHDIVSRRLRVIRDADLAGAVGDDPFPVIDRNAGADRIDRPGRSAVPAGADVDLGQRRLALQTGDINVVEAVRVLPRRDGDVGIAACRRNSGSTG